MKNPRVNYRAEEKVPGESFSGTVRELLAWQRDGFEDAKSGEKCAEGRDIIKKLFVPQRNSEDGPDRMIRILDFLTSKMKINDGGQLRRKLNELRNGGSISILPTDKQLPPSKVLRSLLAGGYDERIDVLEIASRGQTYALALYLYMHTSGGSEEEMADVLAKLIENYDDPRVSRYEYGIEGLEAEPSLIRMCAVSIEKHNLGQAMRERLKNVLSKEESPDDKINEKNVRLVFRKMRDVQSLL